MVQNIALIFLLAILATSRVQARFFSKQSPSFEASDSILDVVDIAPDNLVSVVYPNGLVVNQGEEVLPSQVQETPAVEFEADADSFYTLILTDADAGKANPQVTEWIHWTVGNIPGSDISAGQTLFPYLGSGPPEGTGYHRYIFLVFRQPGLIVFDDPELMFQEENRGVTTAYLAERYGLGDPEFGNFFIALFEG